MILKADQKKSFLTAISSSVIMRDIGEADLKQIISQDGAEIEQYSKGDIIFSPTAFTCRVGIILSGKAQVYKGDRSDKRIIISTLSESDIFGAITLFGQCDRFENNIEALSSVTVLYLSKNLVENTMRENFIFTKNYLEYLSMRIRFLSSRISSIASNGSDEKLASFLLSKCNGKSGDVDIGISLTDLSTTLGIARASLYRAIDSLVENGAIKKQGRSISIVNIDILRSCCGDA